MTIDPYKLQKRSIRQSCSVSSKMSVGVQFSKVYIIQIHDCICQKKKHSHIENSFDQHLILHMVPADAICSECIFSKANFINIQCELPMYVSGKISRNIAFSSHSIHLCLGYYSRCKPVSFALYHCRVPYSVILCYWKKHSLNLRSFTNWLQ